MYADVLLPLALQRTLTYFIPPGMENEIVPGIRVVVQVGKSKLYTGLVYKVHHDKPALYHAKPILSVVDQEPVVIPQQFRFWEWMSAYYCCTPGEVMNAALPSGLKLSSESKIIRRDDVSIDYSQLTEREHLVMEALEMQPYLTMEDVSRILGIKTIQPLLRNLVNKGWILVEQEIRERYKPRHETYIALTEDADNEERLKQIFDELVRAPKQLEALMYYVHLSSRYTQKVREVKRNDLLKDDRVSATAVKELVKKGVFAEVKKEIGRFAASEETGREDHQLSDEQQQALESIRAQHQEKEVVLLHGVTSSGKTEIYVKLIRQCLEQGKQALYLLPEIALTTQLIQRIHAFFPGRVGVYHSRFNENERVEVWNHVLHFDPEKSDNRFQIILGARSAVFLPYTHLGLVIVDEEHETSFKQYDPAPRYHGRDAAIYLAAVHGARVVLGSATPSVESYYNAEKGKYGLVKLTRRYGHVLLPEVLTADVSYEHKHRRMQGHYTTLLIEHIRDALDRREQVILFQNRRGYSLMLQCHTCGWSPPCKNCDITLTYHKSTEQLRCHYCGYSIPMVAECGACHGHDLAMKGFGTEKVEDELSQLFPRARVARFDLDTTRRKHAYQEILQEFADGSIDILVGTQMVTKGLDFDNVSLVGVLNADNMLHFPDFRSHERAFQLIAQVSGRAGRRQKRGIVVVQTMNPYHAIIQQVIRNDYEGMYRQQLLERRNFHYPPFFRLIHITLRNKEFREVKDVAQAYAHRVRQTLGNRVLGPEVPSVARVRGQFIFTVLVKLEKGVSLPQTKSILMEAIQQVRATPEGKRTRFDLDVDPY